MSGTRIDALTGLRIFAALAVYLNHLPRPPELLHPLLIGIMSSGSMGVTVFFVLSGFVLAHTYFEALRRPTPAALWSFGVARVARIFPVYLLVLAGVFFWIQNPVGGSDGWQWHALALQAWSPDVNFAFGINPVAWSVSIEVFLYACFPLLVPLVARIERGTLSLVVLGAAVAAVVGLLALAFWLAGNTDLPATDPASAHRWLYRMPVTRLGDFLFGIVLARLYLRLAGRREAVIAGAVSSLVLAATIVLVMAYRPAVSMPFRHDFVYMVTGGLLILSLALAPGGPLARLLGWAPIVLFGEASYGFYLLHGHWMTRGGAGAYTIGGAPAGLTREIEGPFMVLGLALVLYVTFERPTRGLIRRALAPSTLRRGLRLWWLASSKPLAPAPVPAAASVPAPAGRPTQTSL